MSGSSAWGTTLTEWAKVNVNYYGSKLTFRIRGGINYGEAS